MGEKGNLSDATAAATGADPATVQRLADAQREMTAMNRAGDDVQRVLGAALPTDRDDDTPGPVS